MVNFFSTRTVSILATAGAIFIGCGSDKVTREEYSRVQRELDAKKTEMANVEKAAKEKEAKLQSEITKKAQELADAEARAKTSGQTQTTPVGGGMPDAKPGECFAEVNLSPVYKTETEQVVKREASEKLTVVPAKYEWTTEKVLVREASKRLVVVPATYDYSTDHVEIQPASKKTRVVPATYETVTEKVEATPAHNVWKRGRGLVEKHDQKSGEIMCLVEVPATYRTITKRVVKTAAETREIEIPAVSKAVRKRVEKTPPTTREIEIPAEYKTMRIRKQVEEAREERTPIEAEYQTVTKKVLVSEGTAAWKRVLCITNSNQNTITEIQRALKAAGHNPGKIDGALGSSTLNAVISYQKEKGLPTGALTLETIESLGLTIQN